MRRGAAVSGGMHAALLALAIWGADLFPHREPVPLDITAVEMVDGAELDARLSTAPVVQSEGPAEMRPPAPGESLPATDNAPDAPQAPAEPAAPELAAVTPPQARPEQPPIEIPPPPTDIPSEAPVPTIAEVPSPDPLNEQSVEPESPPSTEPVQPLASVRPVTPAARPEVPKPQPEAEPKPEPAVETVPQPTAPEPPKPEPAETQEPTPEAVAEAQPDAPLGLAPREARLPVARPADHARAAPAASKPEPQVAAEEPKPEAEKEPEQRQAAAETQKPAEPAGGSSRPTAPLSNGEKDALRLGIKRFYTYSGRPDPGLRVTIRVRLTKEGQIDGKVELLRAEGGDPGSQNALFQAGRRALIQAEGADEFRKLPPEKYGAWQILNVVFTTEKGVDFSS